MFTIRKFITPDFTQKKKTKQVKFVLLAAVVLTSAKNKVLGLLHSHLSDLKIRVAVNSDTSLQVYTLLHLRETCCRKPKPVGLQCSTSLLCVPYIKRALLHKDVYGFQFRKSALVESLRC